MENNARTKGVKTRIPTIAMSINEATTVVISTASVEIFSLKDGFNSTVLYVVQTAELLSELSEVVAEDGIAGMQSDIHKAKTQAINFFIVIGIHLRMLCKNTVFTY